MSHHLNLIVGGDFRRIGRRNRASLTAGQREHLRTCSLPQPLLALVGLVHAVEVRFPVCGVYPADLDVARVGVVRLEVHADSPLSGIVWWIERIELVGIGFHEDGDEEVPAAVWWEVEGPELLHLVDDRLDDDVFVLQDGTLRFTVALTLVLDDVEFG